MTIMALNYAPTVARVLEKRAIWTKIAEGVRGKAGEHSAMGAEAGGGGGGL